ncbi:hypothetical protein N0V83_003471 [Neocucurbitaria cava]|uniref:Uncharacterized protein n=1 Tax=Neocucurbitaria cava TaxID=798079 RepID=A0A9W8YBQ7_9PLEO|nr:hypothetical protein N0V83_003471 [Neocucurbitaria cava]
MVSPKQVMEARSRAGSNVSQRRSSQAGLRQSTVSGGLVGLPGTGDLSLLDPALWAAPVPDLDEFFDMDAFNANEAIATDMANNNYDANQFPHAASSQQYFEQFGQNGLGLQLGNPQIEQQDQNTFSIDQQAEQTYGQYNLVPVGSNFTPPLNYNNNYQYYDPWGNGYTMQMQSPGATPGFSAIPGGSSLPPLPKYPEPEPQFMAGPYFNHSMQPPPIQQYTEYVPTEYPVDPQLLQQQGNVHEQLTNVELAESRPAIYEDHNATAKSKRKRVEPESDSEDEEPIDRRRRQKRPFKRSPATHSGNSHRDSIVSESSSLHQPVKITVVRAGEKPKKCEEKSWVRVNNTTKGETTRTARINHFTDEGPKYKVKPLPVGDWEFGKFKFEYTHHNGMDEFKKRTMTARQIHEYISEFPGDLRIWIQVTPGDSARRYASKSHSECIFEQCPNRQWANKGTIEVGTYRVAFDEKHKTYGKGVVDPFDCVAYAHLYCIERFLDFDYVCQVVDVKVDARGEMAKEPKGEAAFTFSGKHLAEKAIAEKFVKAAKADQLRRTPEFFAYPNHTDYKKGEPKPHDQTLVAAMFNVNWEHRTRSQLKQFVYRNIKPGSFGIHRGDQEIIMVDKKVETLKAFKKARAAKQHKNFDHSAYYDEFHPEINVRIAECLALRAQFQAEDAGGTVPARGGTKKRPYLVNDDEDDESSEDDFEEIGAGVQRQKRAAVSQASRSSPRKKQRINYAEPQDAPVYHDVYDQVAQVVPGYQPASANTRKQSCTQYFPTQAQYAYTDEELEHVLSLARRKSSTLSLGPYTSIMKSPNLTRIPHSPLLPRYSTRTASFNAQPVTSSKEYNVNDSPSQVGVSPAAARAMYDHLQQGRRSSARLARKGSTTPSRDTVETGRVGKRRRN